MNRLSLTLSLAALAMTTGAPAFAKDKAPPPAGTEATIPFAGTNIQDFRADGNKALYIQDESNNWFHASLMGYCPDLPYANAIAFDTGGGAGTLDNFSTIIVGQQRCQIDRLVTSPPPPSKAKKKADK